VPGPALLAQRHIVPCSSPPSRPFPQTLSLFPAPYHKLSAPPSLPRLPPAASAAGPSSKSEDQAELSSRAMLPHPALADSPLLACCAALRCPAGVAGHPDVPSLNIMGFEDEYFGVGGGALAGLAGCHSQAGLSCLARVLQLEAAGVRSRTSGHGIVALAVCRCRRRPQLTPRPSPCRPHLPWLALQVHNSIASTVASTLPDHPPIHGHAFEAMVERGVKHGLVSSMMRTGTLSGKCWKCSCSASRAAMLRLASLKEKRVFAASMP
jgi:hypothetical protein